MNFVTSIQICSDTKFQNDLTNTRKKQLLNFRFLNLFFLEDMQVNKLKNSIQGWYIDKTLNLNLIPRAIGRDRQP